MSSKKSDPKGVATHVDDARATITNEVELERARLLSIDDSGPQDLLSLANHQQSLAPAAPTRVGSAAAAPTITESETARVVRPSRPIQGALSVMRSRVQLDDFTGALELARAILKRDETNQEAIDVVKLTETRLERMYRATIGPLDFCPIVLVAGEQVRWLSIDHRAGFLISMMDGQVSFENILDLSGMPRMDALRILSDLIDNDIIAAR